MMGAVAGDIPEDIEGAQAVAAAIHLARTGQGKGAIREFVTATLGRDLTVPLDEIRPRHAFDATCQGSCPRAIRAFLESDNYGDAIRKAVSLGGDSDTLACMAVGIAQAYYRGVPAVITVEAFARLDPPLAEVVRRFGAHYDRP